MVLLAGLVHGVWGQSTATSPGAAVPGGIPSVASVPVVPTKPGGLAGCLSSLGSMFGGCKRRCCGTSFGQLLNNMVKPLSFITGGIIPPPCPSPTEPGGPGANPATAPGGPNGAAATAEKIKKEEAQAKARLQATRYLGTVSCHYYPEAEAALIASLRTDRNECVRWEAARALGNGCCCTKKTVQALTVAVSGSNKDGNPAEISQRVKAAACEALSLCLNRLDGPVSEQPRPELPPEPEPIPPPGEPMRPEMPPDSQLLGRATTVLGVRSAANDAGVESQPLTRVIAEARHVLAQAREPQAWSVEPGTGKRNLYDLWQNARSEPDVVGGDPPLVAYEALPHYRPVGRWPERWPEIPVDDRGPRLPTVAIPPRESPHPLATQSPSWRSEPPVIEFMGRHAPIPEDYGSVWRPDYPPSFETQSSSWDSGRRPVGGANRPEPEWLGFPTANRPAEIRDQDPSIGVPPHGLQSPPTPRIDPSSWADQSYPAPIGNRDMIGNRQQPRTALRDKPQSYDTQGHYPAGDYRRPF